MNNRVLVYSSLNIDCTFLMDHINRPAETQSSNGLRKSAGGKGANQSVALAKAGSKVFFAGKAGDDGSFILEKMKNLGINTDFVFHTDSGSGQAIIQVDKDGQNSIILYGGGNLEIEKHEIDTVFEAFGKDDILLIDGEINNLSYIVDKASEKGLSICINPSPVNSETLALDLNKASVLIVNEIEGSALTGIKQENYEEICRALSFKFSKTEVVLTAGPNGSYYCYNNKLIHCPAFKTTVVDTTGAGDTFLGYFITMKYKGEPVEKCLETASKAAAIACSGAGAMDSIPSISQVKVPRNNN